MSHSWFAYFLLPAALLGQWGSGVTVHLSIAPAPAPSAHFFAELDGDDGRGVTRQLVQSNELSFPNIPPGRYTLRIVDASGHAVVQYPVFAGSGQFPVEVRLPRSERAAPPAGAVPYYRLLRPLDKVAKREMRAAVEAITTGDTPQAFAHLQSALRRNAYIPEAHGWQGILYLRAHQFDAAKKQLEVAEAQGWKDAALYVNLGILALLQQDRSAAKAYCRRAVQLDPDSAGARRLMAALGATER